MKKKYILLGAFIFLWAAITGNAQNTSPFWSLAGNNNAAATSKLGNTNAVPLRLMTNNAVRVYIASGGNVGIGTSAPSYKLQVVGAANGIYGSGTTYGVRGSGGIYGVYGSGTSYALYGAGGTYGVYGSGTSYGVYGYSSSSYGVVGSSGYIGTYGSGSSYGLYGVGGTYGAYATGSSYGAYGYSSGGYGLSGVSSSSYGVYGSSSSSWGSVNYGVYGVYGSGTTGYGVEGVSSSSYGLYGYSGSNWAVYGNGYIGTYGDGSYTGAWGNGGSYGGVFYGGPYGVYAYGSTYAGYFSGSTYCTGTYVGSDKSLKQNIKEFSSAMDIINKLKPRQYEYRHDGNYDQMNLPIGDHYGLIAQDLELVLPNLVKDSKFETNMRGPVAAKPGANGKPTPEDASSSVSPGSDTKAKAETISFKAVNYIELIPIMIKGMQEQDALIQKQQAQIDELKRMLVSVKGNAVSDAADLSGAWLKQNAPNPFRQSTTIQFSLPVSAKDAQLLVYDQSGRLVKSVAVANGQNQVSIAKGSLPSGNYVYTLMVDGKKVDSKNMIVAK